MQKLIFFIAFLIILLGCGQSHRNDFNNDRLIFKVFLKPAFHEPAEIVISKWDNIQAIRFLLRNIPLGRPNENKDTFYFKSLPLSAIQLEKLDSMVIQKIKIKQPYQSKGIVDGMSVNFELIDKNDTSQLYFRSPDIKSDNVGYKITNSAVVNFREIFKDSIINDYLSDIESYMDDSKEGIRFTDNRAINKLRKIEYSRQF